VPWFFVTTRLCRACTQGDLGTVQSLADARNVNIKGFLGWGPLHNAANAGHSTIAEHLLKLGADVDLRDLENHTPLLLASGIANEDEERVKTVKLLLAHKANPNALDDGKYSALQLAVLNDNQRIVQILIEAGAAVNHQNNDRFTALHAAATNGNARLVQYLLKHGADSKLRDGRGMTAADHAKEAGFDFAKLAEAPQDEKAMKLPAAPQVSASATTKAGQDLEGEIERELKELEDSKK